MTQLYLDAMSIIRTFGKPDLFITFTCNPNWPEILIELKPFEKPNDRPDLIARIFKLKLKALLEDILKHHILGKCVAHIHVIEFQVKIQINNYLKNFKLFLITLETWPASCSFIGRFT